ncbi:hypothetical protein [Bifidobacterium parmae]|nr:hypothetical protein [Bifidobacterium parmae]
MYGDIFLYIPAILHALGLSVNSAYKVFVLLVNAATAGTTFLCAKRVFGSNAIAIVASALWTLAPYRLEDMYMRGAVGEYMALLFAVILLYGLYALFFEERRYAWLWLGGGMVGIVMSHVISIVLIVIPAGVVAVIGLIRNHSLRAWRQIGRSVLAALGACLWYVVPFLDYYAHADMRITHIDASLRVVNTGGNAIEPAQLLMLFVPMSGANFKTADQVGQEMPYALGWAILGGMCLFILAVLVKPRGLSSSQRLAYGIGWVSLALAATLSFVSTNLFPWHESRFSLWNAGIRVLANIQFPWRLVGVASMLLVITAGAGMCCLGFSERYAGLARRLGAGLMVLAFLEAGVASTTWLQNSVPTDAFPTLTQTSREYNGDIGNGEYLPQSFDMDTLKTGLDRTAHADGTSISGYRQDNGTVTFSVDKASEGATVRIPLFMYPNYRIISPAKDYASLSSGRNGVMTVRFDKEYSGDVTITYVEPASWRIAEATSALSIIAVVATPLVRRYRTRQSRKRNGNITGSHVARS